MAVAWPAQARRVQRGASNADEWRRSQVAASGFPFVEQGLDLSCRHAHPRAHAPQIDWKLRWALHSRALPHAKTRCYALTLRALRAQLDA